MTFIITFIALIIERFFDWSHIRQWRWFVTYQAMVNARLRALPAYVILAAIVLPPVLIVGLLNSLLSGWLYGMLKLVFGVIVLVYCLGLKNFWAQTYVCLAALRDPDAIVAREKVQAIFGVTLAVDAQSFHRALTSLFFIEANRRLFAVIFWFILLGPMGSVLYCAIDLCKKGLVTMQAATVTQAYLDWIPVRLFTFMFALGGHFTGVIQHWRQYVLASPRVNDTLLKECGIAAVDVLEVERIPEDGTAEKETLALLDRVFIIALVILAVIVLIK